MVEDEELRYERRRRNKRITLLALLLLLLVGLLAMFPLTQQSTLTPTSVAAGPPATATASPSATPLPATSSPTPIPTSTPTVPPPTSTPTLTPSLTPLPDTPTPRPTATVDIAATAAVVSALGTAMAQDRADQANSDRASLVEPPTPTGETSASGTDPEAGAGPDSATGGTDEMPELDSASDDLTGEDPTREGDVTGTEQEAQADIGPDPSADSPPPDGLPVTGTRSESEPPVNRGLFWLGLFVVTVLLAVGLGAMHRRGPWPDGH